MNSEITTKNLENFLSENFIDVKYEKLVSRYPDSYSSFKVLLPCLESENFIDDLIDPKELAFTSFLSRSLRSSLPNNHFNTKLFQCWKGNTETVTIEFTVSNKLDLLKILLTEVESDIVSFS